MARCKDCGNRTHDRFCKWLGAFLQPGLNDDPDCEGFTSKNIGPKSSQKEGIGNVARPAQISEPSLSACPKTQHLDKKVIQTVLSLKKLKGSVVREKVRCGKRSCHCQSGVLHGPYLYLHYYSGGKVRRKYLTKTVSDLLSLPERQLRAILGQGGS